MKTTPASQIINHLRKSVLNVDDAWSVDRPGGFSWWPHHQRQDVFVDRQRTEADGRVLERLVVSTEIATLEKAEFANHGEISALTGLATLSGMVCEGRSLRLHAHAWVDRSNQPLYSLVLGLVAGLQIHEAAFLAAAVLQAGLGQPATTPHPRNGLRVEPDEIASLVDTLIAPIGLKETPWPDEMFEDLVGKFLGGPPCLLATDAPTGMAAEFPFGTESSLLQATTDQVHPVVGKGLWLLNSFSMEDIPGDHSLNPLSLNAWEIEHANQPFFGSWCPPKDDRLDYVTFVPNLMSQTAAAQNFILLGVGRARLMSIEWLGDDWSKTWDDEGHCRARTALERAAAENRE
jgi:hypothetical protein